MFNGARTVCVSALWWLQILYSSKGKHLCTKSLCRTRPTFITLLLFDTHLNLYWNKGALLTYMIIRISVCAFANHTQAFALCACVCGAVWADRNISAILCQNKYHNRVVICINTTTAAPLQPPPWNHVSFEPQKYQTDASTTKALHLMGTTWHHQGCQLGDGTKVPDSYFYTWNTWLLYKTDTLALLKINKLIYQCHPDNNTIKWL